MTNSDQPCLHNSDTGTAPLTKVSFLLCNPRRAENIGAAARALKTMGMADSLELLISHGHIHEDCYRVAHGSADVLDRAVIHRTITQALDNADLIIGTTARSRTLSRKILPPWEAAQILKRDGGKRKVLLFGPEDSGLSNEVLAKCHLLTEIPMAGTYPSLNLAQSVMILAYELFIGNYRIPDTAIEIPIQDPSRAVLINKIKNYLEAENIPEQGTVFMRVSEAVARADREDIRLLHHLMELLKK
ncbi:MAG: hypothetical protein CVV64_09930 [Candidatus Wallbacteria bacterium HGW-Wallbacteria-1]|jgi:tRNA/rRNA methyltransferase|uniref:tRNA/rRNA methyltransferase SpoU type domain-containing protein n=1 Tax=Candidatus Wallbacteria bacterium HGW-Wallbacteria-1 TaxID=2013854 RepID=A0A2N1PPL2_9BACT|nr:MAG: hypothetical protein CVV64_09930 [Candidatus Wallbacteria bacterium HGW-Wallbacteria-1]